MEFAVAMARDFLDLEALLKVARRADPLGTPLPCTARDESGERAMRPVIGVLRDAAFQFYYPENLEALQECGAIVKEISSFDERPLPTVDALYVGGGFPESHLETLARNRTFRNSLRGEIEGGLPVYAECGGLMFLCRDIRHEGKVFPMAGVFPYLVAMEKKPQGHGYTVLECVADNPYFPVGANLKGHEFHYSRIIGPDSSTSFVFNLSKGHGILAGKDGLCYKRTLASYSHIHAVGNSVWAQALVSAGLSHKLRRSSGSLDLKSDAERGMTGKAGLLNRSLEGGNVYGNS
jgi:cobyrinic acid a,c-diamide synthase